ncbi:hypothetical protein Q9R08_14885 [Microbacterium sp. QXD-8]|uniref:beta-mannosidase n=1 Tax=Microbacterium psychrotolerans TaxID=3068321 RepID=A0ABU0Z5H7_9MICO|nr:hypothetical protein [Microbacterium sp. QXD-8]MDQ7879273.1 hypothetical protein [Microbacterium sp. QXD-8]
MRRIHSLSDDEWEMREALGDTWQWHIRKPAERRNSVTMAAQTDAWIRSRVPGSVVDDLVRAGEVRTPYFARQTRESEWTAERHWVYRRLVDVPRLDASDGVWLELEGVDPGGWVFWDGRLIGEITGLHNHTWLRVGGEGDPPVAVGAHTLAVVIRPAEPTEPQVGRTDRVRALSPRLTSGWDFAPRLRHQGIWRDVRLVIGPSALTAVSARSSVDLDAGTGSVIVEASVDAVDAPSPPVTAVLLRDGVVVATETSTAGTIRLDLEEVELWQPIGHGGQTLYDLRVTSGGHTRSFRVGFRDARLVPNHGAPVGALGYTAVINGDRVPLVGWNWAPVDIQFGTIDATRTRHLVDLAADSGARILRVWGGGLLESEEFYEACDERGLLVWQEFSQSSSGTQSTPSADAAFVAHAVDQALRAVERLAHHASLFVWCGGNELEDDLGPLDETRSPVLAAMRDTLAAADPGRAWLPTSPSGPTFHHRLDRIAADPEGQHDVHGPWEHQGLEGHHTLADAGTNLAHTEFGVEGMAGMRSLRGIVPAESLWPADRSNPVYRHLGEWWNNADLVSECFGGRIDGIEQLGRASQWLQATGLQYAIEADRRRWPRCSMVLPWQLAESFPNAWCTSVVEWSGEAKPAFHAATRAFARDRVTLQTPRSAWAGHERLTARAWVWSERGVSPGSIVLLRLRDAAGRTLKEVSASALDSVGEPRPVVALEVAHVGSNGIVIWEAEWRDAAGRSIDVERSVATLGADLGGLLDLPAAQLHAAVHDDGHAWRIRIAHVSGAAAIGAGLRDARPWGSPGRALVRDDPRPLLPGESREHRVEWRGVAPAERALSLDAWNVPAIPLVSSATDDRPRAGRCRVG